ncbi:MAG: hypothetical protein ABI472_10375 [Ginsengibacter sp.]
MKKSKYLYTRHSGRFALIILGILTCTSGIAQENLTPDSIPAKKRIYKVSLVTSDLKINSGYLANLGDSTLYVSQYPVYLTTFKPEDKYSAYSCGQVQTIELRRKGSVGRGLWKGALVGLSAGVIAGFASGDDPVAPVYDNPNDPLGTILSSVFSSTANAFRMTAGQKAAVYGITGAATGALIGTIIGAIAKKKFFIGGSKQRYREMRQRL